ncbi:histidine biosynthesis protein HisF:Imidazole glycerol phosphate synthase [Pavlovales sp. CCMP2436]|nr:histidine biosynthesis protein HisF:Imidazole glycerol phosphate synthase [Pavlovales sp. CCMP2436]
MVLTVSLLDYGAGNVRSVRNALVKLGYPVVDVDRPEQLRDAQVVVFPGVGSFGSAMAFLKQKGFLEPLREYVRADRPYVGICLGMQTLFEGSEESPGVKGLGVLPGVVRRFREDAVLAVPQIGWNGAAPYKQSPALTGLGGDECVYFVHSYHVPLTDELHEWVLSTTTYGVDYVSAVHRGNVLATQFHPEKSSRVGLMILDNHLRAVAAGTSVPPSPPPLEQARSRPHTVPRKRVVACLDVRSNDAGDLVVTKGDSYNVREEAADGKGAVRNLGMPVALASRYYEEGADEITFLNITGFRDSPVEDLPMLALLVEASQTLFVPLCVGGGIKDYVDAKGEAHSAVEVAAAYFRAGADKISIGSEAVSAAKAYWAAGGKGDGKSCIEQIAHVYGRQAVVISVDPRRVWVAGREAAGSHADACLESPQGALGPNGERLCWYECTVQGGRAGSDLDVVQLAKGCEALGAGELLLNSIDADGQNSGFDLALVAQVKSAVSIPVIASSGAGKPEDFSDVFEATGVEAALAAGIFHRKEWSIGQVKEQLRAKTIAYRPS